MDNEKIAAFFDELAEGWDEHLIIEEDKIERILDDVGIREGDDVLDVACGTGVLFPFYEKRRVKSITGIDISPRMAEIARGKEKAEVITGDATAYPFEKKFDRILIYNAFPHIKDRERFFVHMDEILKEGGTFTIAHSMGREALLKHHHGVSEDIADILPKMEELEEKLKENFDIVNALSEEDIYLITVRKKIV